LKLHENNRCCWEFIECVEERHIIGWSSPHQSYVILAPDGKIMRIHYCPRCGTGLLPDWYTGSREEYGGTKTFTLNDAAADDEEENINVYTCKHKHRSKVKTGHDVFNREFTLWRCNNSACGQESMTYDGTYFFRDHL
jgi:hypothetical protein